MGNGQDSSAGTAEDRKSSCHQFKSGSWHMTNNQTSDLSSADNNS